MMATMNSGSGGHAQQGACVPRPGRWRWTVSRRTRSGPSEENTGSGAEIGAEVDGPVTAEDFITADDGDDQRRRY